MPFEGENLASKLAIAGTSQFKTQNVKKKIDLPVQKNLLTKYFCFASLEAKRKFIAPRVSPTTANQSALDSSSVSPPEHETLEAAASEKKNSAEFIADSMNCGSGPSANNHIESCSASKSSEFTESPCHVLTGDEKKRSPGHTILRQSRQPIHKPCLELHKEHGHTNFQDTVEGKTREATRKVIVRSAYFQHKQVEKNGCDEKQDCLSKAGNAIAKQKNSISDSHLCNNHMKNKDLKRKISPNDNIQSENLQPRQMLPASPPHNIGYCDHNVDRPHTENNAAEKFGANISHLGHYSEIAEKSMERFVSVISSFSCSSGSRASGLRAPLRDVRNTCNNRPTAVDFKQYAYVPKQTKTSRIGPGS